MRSFLVFVVVALATSPALADEGAPTRPEELSSLLARHQQASLSAPAVLLTSGVIAITAGAAAEPVARLFQAHLSEAWGFRADRVLYSAGALLLGAGLVLLAGRLLERHGLAERIHWLELEFSALR